MTFPIHVKPRKSEAVIYGRTAAYQFYRVAHYVNGKRILRSFASYALVGRRLSHPARIGPRFAGVSALSAGQGDAIAGLERLEGLFKSTGKRANLPGRPNS